MKVEHHTDDPEWELRPVRLVSEPFQYKPANALYVSPVDSKYSWKQWCAEEKYHCGIFCVEMEIDATNLLIIDSEIDSHNLAWKQLPNAPTLRHVDWIFMKDSGVTGIWLTEKGQMETRWKPNGKYLYGWDCETIAILDSNIVISWKKLWQNKPEEFK